MIKYFIALFLLTSEAYAYTYKAACVGNRGKVSVAISTYKDRMYFQYANADGAKEFPLYEGTVTKSSMVFIKLAEKELASVDNQLQVSWPAEDCNVSEKDHRIVECNGEGRVDLPKAGKLRSFAFFTTVVREEAIANTFETFKVRISLQGEDFLHSIAMPFDPRHCGVEYIK